MTLKLNIYNKKEIVKTYTSETVDLTFGQLEDVICILDGKRLDNNEDMVNLVRESLPELKELLKYIFEGLTDDELRNTRISELIQVCIRIFHTAIMEIRGIGSKN